MFKNVAAIRKACAGENSMAPFWFSEESMAFFNTRVMDEVYNMGEFGTLFITADRPDEDVNEAFAIRWAHMQSGIFTISTLGNLMEYATLSEAWDAAESISKALPDIVRFSR